MNRGYVYPCFRRIGQGFIVLAQPAASTQPRQRSFDHPPSRQHLELMAGPWTLHNLKDVARMGPHPIYQLPSVSGVCPNQSEARKPPFQLVYNQFCSVSVLDVSRMDHNSQQQPYGIHDDVTLATHHLLTSIIATRPPFSVVLTDWLSMTAALGVHSLPSARRTFGRSASWTPSHVPSFFHLRKYWYTVCHGGKSCGSILQGHPVRRTYWMPLMTSLISTVRGLPPGLAAGSNGASIFHWASVKSLGYAFLSILQSLTHF